MKREEMIELVENGVPAIDVAIKKWEDIVNGKGVNLENKNCALCYVYKCEDYGDWSKEQWEEILDDEMTCPIIKWVNEGSCNETPYYMFREHLEVCEYCVELEDAYILCIEGEQLAKNMLNFLINCKEENGL